MIEQSKAELGAALRRIPSLFRTRVVGEGNNIEYRKKYDTLKDRHPYR